MLNLSIVILTCNQKDYTLRVLDSLSPFMSEESGAEVIVVDNGSTDGTAKAVAAKHYGWGDRLVYKILEKNRGVAAGRNVGLRLATRDVFMILDNDTIVNVEALRYLYERLTADRTIGVIAPALYSPAGELQDSAKPYPGLGIKIRHFISQKWRRSDESVRSVEFEPVYVIGACQMFRREVWEHAGPLDEAIFYGPEDADFCLRVKASGLRILYTPSASIIHDWQRATSGRSFATQLTPRRLRLTLRHIQALFHFYISHRRLF